MHLGTTPREPRFRTSQDHEMKLDWKYACSVSEVQYNILTALMAGEVPTALLLGCPQARALTFSS